MCFITWINEHPFTPPVADHLWHFRDLRQLVCRQTENQLPRRGNKGCTHQCYHHIFTQEQYCKQTLVVWYLVLFTQFYTLLVIASVDKRVGSTITTSHS